MKSENKLIIFRERSEIFGRDWGTVGWAPFIFISFRAWEKWVCVRVRVWGRKSTMCLCSCWLCSSVCVCGWWVLVIASGPKGTWMKVLDVCVCVRECKRKRERASMCGWVGENFPISQWLFYYPWKHNHILHYTSRRKLSCQNISKSFILLGEEKKKKKRERETNCHKNTRISGQNNFFIVIVALVAKPHFRLRLLLLLLCE